MLLGFRFILRRMLSPPPRLTADTLIAVFEISYYWLLMPLIFHIFAATALFTSYAIFTFSPEMIRFDISFIVSLFSGRGFLQLIASAFSRWLPRCHFFAISAFFRTPAASEAKRNRNQPLSDVFSRWPDTLQLMAYLLSASTDR
jgi:hypothetical protein